MMRVGLSLIFSRSVSSKATHEGFLPLEIRGLTDVQQSSAKQSVSIPRKEPLYKKYPESIDWTNIWPMAASFNYAVVPFPIRQGYCKNLAENKGISPEKYGNAELMKIPNFLHLTDAHIQKHCDAIRKFCTKWPEGLNSPEVIEKYYPLEIINRNYLFTASSIRDKRARVATLRVRLSHLNLDERSKRKLLRLTVGPGPGQSVASYNWDTDILELTSERCPTSKQNIEYLTYVLTVLTLESKKIEAWETKSVEYDWDHFEWDKSKSLKRLKSILAGSQTSDPETSVDEKINSDPIIDQYRNALKAIWSSNDILNQNQWIVRPDPPKMRHCRFPPIRNVPFLTIPGADNLDHLEQYGKATRQLMGLSSPLPAKSNTSDKI